MAANQFNVTELDFESIKDNLKNYLKSQSKFNDYDFEGSAMSVLLDVLAYNTHYNAISAHYSLNEAFLDSAQIRSNVVSHAKLLAYIPRPTLASTTFLTIVVANPVGDPPPNFLTVKRGTKFVTNLGSEQYPWVVSEAQTAQYDSLNNRYVFPKVTLKQGILKKIQYRVDESIPVQKFEIPEETVDLTTLRVRVRENENSSRFDTFVQFTDLGSLEFDTAVYFVGENSNSRYEVYFGDGNLGKKLTNDNIVELEYVYSSGEEGNGATSFRIIDDIGGNTNIFFNVLIKSLGGAPRESIESIRFNAPLSFISQNRAVTADDYAALIKQGFPNIESISVWGGENQPVPDFGKVFIAIKPIGADSLTSIEKDQIINLIRPKNVVSITPTIVDPEFTYLDVQVDFKYNPFLTDLVQEEVEFKVLETLQKYNSENINKFDGVFRSSQLLRLIDSSEPSILNSTLRVKMVKRITTLPDQRINYFDLQFSGPLQNLESEQSIISDPLIINGEEFFLGDRFVPGDPERQVFIYKLIGDRISVALPDVGKLNPQTGVLSLYGFRTDESQNINIYSDTLSNDIAPKRNQLISIDEALIKITGEVDTIATAGSAGAIIYRTTPK